MNLQTFLLSLNIKLCKNIAVLCRVYKENNYLFSLTVLRLAAKEIAPKVLIAKKWFQFLQEAPVMLTGELVLAYQFGVMIWVLNLPAHVVSLNLLHG